MGRGQGRKKVVQQATPVRMRVTSDILNDVFLKDLKSLSSRLLVAPPQTPTC